MKAYKNRGRISSPAIAAIVLVAAIALMLGGCSSGDANGKSSQQPSSTESPQEAFEPLSLAYLNKAGYETVIVADRKGFFEAAKPSIELLSVSGSGQQAVEALLAGSADIAATGQGPVADALGQYGDEIVVLCGTNCNTDSQIIVAAPSLSGDAALVAYNKAIDNKAQVKASFEKAAVNLGRSLKLGVQQGATTESAAKSWLSAMGIAFNDFAADGTAPVTLVNVKANTLPTVLATSSDIDLMAASQPYPDTALSHTPGAYRVGSNADTNSYDVAAFITTKDIYAKKEPSIKEFVKALNQSTDYLANTENETENIQICAASTGSSEDSVRTAFKVADWNTVLSDTMIDSIVKAAQKKGYPISAEDVSAACPLLAWLNTELSN